MLAADGCVPAADDATGAAEAASCRDEPARASPAAVPDATITASAANRANAAAEPWDRRGREVTAMAGTAGAVATRRSIRSASAALRRLSGSLQSSPLITGHSGPAVVECTRLQSCDQTRREKSLLPRSKHHSRISSSEPPWSVRWTSSS